MAVLPLLILASLATCHACMGDTLGTIGGMAGARHLAVEGQYAYLTTLSSMGPSDPFFHIIDVSVPTQPRSLGGIPNPEGLGNQVEYNRDIAVQNGLALVTAGDGDAVVVANVSDPSNPELLQVFRHSQLETPRQIALSSYAYVGVLAGVVILDVSSPANVAVAGLLDVGWVVALAVDGAFLYASTWSYPQGRFVVADISTPTVPVALAAVETFYMKSTTGTMSVKDNFVYVSGENLLVWDVSVPASPSVVYHGSGSTSMHAVSGSYLYETRYFDRRLRVLDITIPDSPAFYVSTSFNNPWDVAASQTYIYAVNDGLVVLNATACPSQATTAVPRETSSTAQPSHTTSTGEAAEASYFSSSLVMSSSHSTPKAGLTLLLASYCLAFRAVMEAYTV
eukprot:s1341_g27.t1